jgi:hypothetical protein
MDPFLLLAIGVLIVVGAIVWLRLHAFIALFSAAIVVSALTPKQQIEQAVLAQQRPAAEATARANEPLGAKLATNNPSQPDPLKIGFPTSRPLASCGVSATRPFASQLSGAPGHLGRLRLRRS